MNSYFLPKIIKFSVVFLFFIGGCAPALSIRGSENAQPPKIIITPEIELTDIPTNKRFKVAIDDKGLAHVLVPVPEKGELYHLVVDEGGILEKEVVMKSDYLDRLDIASDKEGNLYAIVDYDHLVLREGKWQTLTKLPDRCKWFALSGKNIVCAYELKGEEVGAPDRWDWYWGGLGGIFGIIPLHTHAQKIVITIGNEAGWSNKFILDSAEELDEYLSSVSTDDEGAIHIMYRSSVSGNFIQHAAMGDVRYARIDPSMINESSGNTDLRKVEGLRISWEEPLSFAIDSKTGILLLASWDKNSRSYKTCTIKYPSLERDLETNFFSGGTISKIYFLSMGDDEFQALVDGHYFNYINNVWSAPIELTGMKATGKTEFVSDRSGGALVIWQKENKRLAGQWIKPIREH